jgi:hypothetical protein
VLEAYRDEGVVGWLVPRSPGWFGPPLLRISAAMVPWFLALGLTGRRAEHWPVAATLGWLLVWGAFGSRESLSGRYDFLIPPLVFVAEAVGLLRLAAIAGDHDVAAGFAFLAVVVLCRYDLVYRGVSGPPRSSAELLAGGWELRLVTAYALAAGSVVQPGDYVLAGILAALLGVTEVAAWQDPGGRRGRPVGAAAEELS